MTRPVILGVTALTVVVGLLALAVGHRALVRELVPSATTSPAHSSGTTVETAVTRPGAERHDGFLYGRIATADGATYRGRLRWGRDEEAFWNDFFNGRKSRNPWGAYLPREEPADGRRPLTIFGVELSGREHGRDLDRPFMVRFGDIAGVEARGRDVRVTLVDGTVTELDRLSAGDFDDGVRVWDATRGVVDLDSLRIRSIEFLPTPPLDDAPYRLQGTVDTRQGEFTGFVRWNRSHSVGVDHLAGHSGGRELAVRLDAVRSIARRSDDASLVTLLDGRELLLSGTPDVGEGNKGIYVHDPRYGRVLISWDAFERVEFEPGGSGPGRGDFPPGSPLTGSVATRDGSRFTGRLVFDLDESDTVETLDAPSRDVDYSIPFGLIAAIEPAVRDEDGAARATVALHGGERLQLDRAGDLGEGNGGLLIFVDGRERPEYVRWTDVERIELDRPTATYPPLDER